MATRTWTFASSSQQDGGLLVYQPRSVVFHFESQSGPERFRQVAHNTQAAAQEMDRKNHAGFRRGAGRAHFSNRRESKSRRTFANPRRQKTAPIASIIILAHNQLEHTRLCLDSIRAHTPLPHELILVDNGSTDGTPEYFRSLAARQGNVVVITNPRNLGFAAGNNQGLAVARGDCVVLLNNDTVVTEGWLEKMLAALQRHPDIGVVGPMSNYVAGPQLVSEAAYSNLDGIAASSPRNGRAPMPVKSQDIGRVVGFCLLARRSVIERIGGLDEQFGSGNFEDDDFCLRAGFAGFRICIAQDAFIHHTGSQTFKGAKIDYRESMLRNWKLFKAKWAMPQDAPIENGYRVPAIAAARPGAEISPAGTARNPRPPANGQRQGRDAQSPPARPANCPAALRAAGPARRGPRIVEKEKNGRRVEGHASRRSRRGRSIRKRALLLAEIAQAAGDSVSARHCAQHARHLAPEWKPAKQFLKGNLRGNNKHGWLALPPEHFPSAKSKPPRA